MDTRRQLGEFLQTRRSQVRPTEVGLAGNSDRRRVTGLRREELALLAGVSASYYARLEQGYSLNASAEVLNAIARALRLNEAEHRHLHDLAAGSRVRPAARRSPPERMTAGLTQLVETMGETPVLVMGRYSDVLAWNRTGHALFAGHLDPADPDLPRNRPNMARLVFLDQHTRELYADWPAKARAVVGNLRLAAGRHPDDVAISALIGELTVQSPDFSDMWAAHRVKAGGDATYEMRHPLVGAMTVTQQSLQTEQGRTVVIATTEPGSPSREAMSLLAHLTAFTTETQPAKQFWTARQ
ncbi:helix-turn-helix domain-containing protein [Micromonospora sp. NBC_01813]|uniref:helix-turn-helix domain-containing protein n=1 Tax=Micromonospora sp. NBC_01813 TaxID=2975988 RepID=UPI002DDBF5E4|nr:helix-turn-helix transcriptional regulator [Micromonospora sp. NBC_01813]WSA07696.1 helix-turn-helix transcriptional regulator [Micromonospora sp. NBC_01813]